MTRPLQPRHATAATIVAVGITPPAAHGGPTNQCFVHLLHARPHTFTSL